MLIEKGIALHHGSGIRNEDVVLTEGEYMSLLKPIKKYPPPKRSLPPLRPKLRVWNALLASRIGPTAFTSDPGTPRDTLPAVSMAVSAPASSSSYVYRLPWDSRQWPMSALSLQYELGVWPVPPVFEDEPLHQYYPPPSRNRTECATGFLF